MPSGWCLQRRISCDTFELVGGMRQHITIIDSVRPSTQTSCGGPLSWKNGHDANPWLWAALTPHVDRCLWSFWLWGSVPHFPVIVVVPMAPAFQTGDLQLHEESILLQQLLHIVLACAVWGPEWRGSSVTMHCDNMGAVAAVNSGYSKVPQIMHLLWWLFFIWAFFGLSVWAVHELGLQNTRVDAISCNCPIFSPRYLGVGAGASPFPTAC